MSSDSGDATVHSRGGLIGSAGKRYGTILSVVVVLVCANLSQLFVPEVYSWVVVVAMVGVLAFVARRSGLGIDQLGLSRKAAGKGLAWGGAAVAAVLIVLTVAYFVAPSLFADSRYHNSIWYALEYALIFIPLHTVLAEEFAFRGVLWASLHRLRGARYATVVSSMLFGLWHIVPSLGISHSNTIASGTHTGNIGPIFGIVCATTLAGVAFCELRRRSGSLLAPILAHWAINGVAVILAALAWA